MRNYKYKGEKMRNYQVIKIMKENVLVEGYFGNGLERRNIAKCNINPDIDLYDVL